MLARYGGEEFVVICRETDEPSATVLAERIRQAVAGHGFEYHDSKIPVTISLGVACLDQQRVGDSEALVEAADKALYQAKAGGRNRVVRQTG